MKFGNIWVEKGRWKFFQLSQSMKKKPPKTTVASMPAPDLFVKLSKRRRRPLILPRKLREEADSFIHRGDRQERAHKLLVQWADLELQGALAKKETSLDADFLLKVF